MEFSDQNAFYSNLKFDLTESDLIQLFGEKVLSHLNNNPDPEQPEAELDATQGHAIQTEMYLYSLISIFWK